MQVLTQFYMQASQWGALVWFVYSRVILLIESTAPSADFFFPSYTEELSFIYMAARMDGVFAAVSRAFHEVSCSCSFWDARSELVVKES